MPNSRISQVNSVRGGKFERKFGEFAPFTLHSDLPSMLPDQTITNAQSQTHPFADVLRRKKRIKNLVKMLRLDAFAIVVNDDDALVSGDLTGDLNPGSLVSERLFLHGIK